MNKELKIAVDYDGCLAKTSCFICELINFRTGSNHTFKEINSWDYWDRIGKGKDFWDSYDFLDKNGRLSIKPYDEYVGEALNELNRLFGDFNIVTANNESAKKQIIEWINTLYVTYEDYPYFNVNCIGRKTAAEKLELDYNIYIDDNPNLAKEAKNHPNKFILLANAPWNKEIPNSFNVRRFESWKEVPRLIESLGEHEGK